MRLTKFQAMVLSELKKKGIVPNNALELQGILRIIQKYTRYSKNPEIVAHDAAHEIKLLQKGIDADPWIMRRALFVIQELGREDLVKEIKRELGWDF